MAKKKKRRFDIIRSKLGQTPGGGFDFMPPSAGRYLVKNGKEEKDSDGNVLESLSSFRLCIREIVEEMIESDESLQEIIRKCGDKWCLYTKSKDKKTGRRRRLGTHSSKSGAYRQERAIKASGG